MKYVSNLDVVKWIEGRVKNTSTIENQMTSKMDERCIVWVEIFSRHYVLKEYLLNRFDLLLYEIINIVGIRYQ